MLADDHDVLIRCFPDLAARDRAEDEFYGSAAWREGPRAAVLSDIESYHEVVIDASSSAVQELRGG